MSVVPLHALDHSDGEHPGGLRRDLPTPHGFRSPISRRCPPGEQRNRQAVRQDLLHYVAHRDVRSRDRVIQAYKGLAYSLARRFAQRGEEADDLNQVAMLGLLKAVERFDPERGVEITSFATTTILGELKRHLRDRGWSVRLPRRVHDLHLQAQQVIDDLTQELGRSPSMLEIAHRLGADLDEVIEALDASGLRHNASLDAPVSASDGGTLTSHLGREDAGIEDVDRRLQITPLLAALTERQRRILGLRFGQGYSQAEIATTVGISQMQVSRILARTLAELRQWSEAPARAAAPVP